MLDTREDQEGRRLDLREKVMTMPPSPRVERLRRRYLDTRNKAVTDAGRLLTRSMKETEGEPQMSRRAKGFAAIVRGVPTNIYPDELFVGWLWSEPRGTEVSVRHLGLESELDTISTRRINPYPESPSTILISNSDLPAGLMLPKENTRTSSGYFMT